MLVFPSLTTVLLVRILHPRRHVWPFLTTFMLMASSGMMLPVITRNQLSVNKDHNCSDQLHRTLLLFIYLSIIENKTKKLKKYIVNSIDTYKVTISDNRYDNSQSYFWQGWIPPAFVHRYVSEVWFDSFFLWLRLHSYPQRPQR